MSDFTLVTKEQCERLVISKKRGKQSALTDFSILLGGATYNFITVQKKGSLENRAGAYWTKSDNEFSIKSKAYSYSKYGFPILDDVILRDIGARIVLPFSSIDSIPHNESNSNLVKSNDGILEIEYGYYPQNAVSKDMQEKLESEFDNGKVIETSNSYTTDSKAFDAYDEPFSPKKHQEYEYDGKRYVRVEANYSYKDKVLSNGESYENGDIVWIEVLPVKWLVDMQEMIMITEKIIFAGVQFHHDKKYYLSEFDKTDIKIFIDKYFSKELLQLMEMERHGKKLTKLQKNKNPYNLDFSEASEIDIIRGAIQSNVSIFLHGKPGSGKSDRVKQLDPDFIELNLSQLDPELLDGLAGEKDGKAVHIKPPWLEELEEKCEREKDKIHILFLEEMTNASEIMQSKAYGIALDKKVAGRWKLPENARVVAAGNEIEDSIAVNEMPRPLYDRFAHITIETTAEKWLEWAVTPEEYYERIEYKKEEEKRSKIHPAIYAFISLRGDEVLRTPYNDEKPEPHADPRRWKMASDMLYETENPSTLKAIIGEKLTKEFIYFCQTPVITLEEAR